MEKERPENGRDLPLVGVGPEPTLGTRLLFAWFGIVASVTTAVMAVVQLITHQFHPTATNFKRVAGTWGRIMLGLVGVRVDVEDRAKLDRRRPYVFVANHQNLLDILALSGFLPYPFGFVAKAELAKVPFLGFAIRNSASIFIDKSDPRSAVKSLQIAGERIRNGNSVLIFAEGLRTYSPVLAPFKKGAFTVAVEAGVPLVPVTILDAYRLMDERKKTMRPGRIHIVVGAPLAIEGSRRSDIPAIMDEMKRRVEAPMRTG